MRLKASSLSI